MAVDVAGEHRGEAVRDRAAGDHVRLCAKYVIDRTDSGALHRLMKTEKTKRRRNGSPSGSFDEAAKPVSHVIAFAGETGHRDADSADVQWNRARPVEEMDPGMHSQKRVRNCRALMVSRYDDHRHPGVGDALERLEHAHDESWFDATPEEYVAAVNHQIDVTSKGGLQGELVSGEKILPSAMAIGTRPLGEIES